MFSPRPANENDFDKIYSLYKKVATEKIGIARSSEEITENYIHEFMKNASATGIELVVEDPSNPKRFIAEIHCYKLAPKVFSHLLSELTIIVDQDFHGKGLGKMIFTNLLDLVIETRPDIFKSRIGCAGIQW